MMSSDDHIVLKFKTECPRARQLLVVRKSRNDVTKILTHAPRF